MKKNAQVIYCRQTSSRQYLFIFLFNRTIETLIGYTSKSRNETWLDFLIRLIIWLSEEWNPIQSLILWKVKISKNYLSWCLYSSLYIYSMFISRTVGTQRLTLLKSDWLIYSNCFTLASIMLLLLIFRPIPFILVVLVLFTISI